MTRLKKYLFAFLISAGLGLGLASAAPVKAQASDSSGNGLGIRDKINQCEEIEIGKGLFDGRQGRLDGLGGFSVWREVDQFEKIKISEGFVHRHGSISGCRFGLEISKSEEVKVNQGCRGYKPIRHGLSRCDAGYSFDEVNSQELHSRSANEHTRCRVDVFERKLSSLHKAS